jgi:hypothetical protein
MKGKLKLITVCHRNTVIVTKVPCLKGRYEAMYFIKNTNSHNVRNAISDPGTFTKVHVIHIPNLTLNFSAKLRGLIIS